MNNSKGRRKITGSESLIVSEQLEFLLLKLTPDSFLECFLISYYASFSDGRTAKIHLFSFCIWPDQFFSWQILILINLSIKNNSYSKLKLEKGMKFLSWYCGHDFQSHNLLNKKLGILVKVVQ